MKLDMVFSYFLSVQDRESFGHCCVEISVQMSLAQGVIAESIYRKNMQEKCAGD